MLLLVPFDYSETKIDPSHDWILGLLCEAFDQEAHNWHYWGYLKIYWWDLISSALDHHHHLRDQ